MRMHLLCCVQASASEAGSQLPSSAKGYLGYVLANRNAAQILPLIENAVECRTEIKEAMTGNRCSCCGVTAVHRSRLSTGEWLTWNGHVAMAASSAGLGATAVEAAQAHWLMLTKL